jgi:hypothetical protein
VGQTTMTKESNVGILNAKQAYIYQITPKITVHIFSPQKINYDI